MSLINLIAQSGSRNYETMRKGWLPNQDERRARTLADLQVQKKQQEVNYEPERQRIKRRNSESTSNYRDAIKGRVRQQIKTAVSKNDWDKYKNNFSVTSRIIKGAFNVYSETNDISEAKRVIRENYDAIIEAGDDGTDKAVDHFLSADITDKESEQLMTRLNSVMPSVQKQIDTESLAQTRKRGSSGFERTLQAALNSGEIDQSEYNRRMDERSQKLSGVQQDFVKIENDEGGFDIWDKANNVIVGKLDGVKSGVQGRHEDTNALAQQSFKNKIKQQRTTNTKSLRTEASAELSSITAIDKNITKALQSQEAGDKGLSDKYVTLLLTQVNPTKFRAFKMYEVFDTSFGNLYERTKDTVNKVVYGSRTDEQNEIIRSFLLKMQELNKPVLAKTKAKYRSMAEKSGYDVDMVVPFETMEGLKNYPGWGAKQKLEYLKKNLYLIKKKTKK